MAIIQARFNNYDPASIIIKDHSEIESVVILPVKNKIKK